MAFLDIMSCGLGAIILVLMLVKHNVERVSPESDLLGADLVRLEAAESALRERIADLLQDGAATVGQIEARAAELERSRAELARRRAEIAARENALQALKGAVETGAPGEQPDVIELDRSGEETYIVGLRVEGARIGVLVDASASMTEEDLIGIIRRKNMSQTAKMDGPKWQRTRRVVEWLLARLPEDSMVDVVVFNDQARRLGDPKGTPGGDGPGLERILSELEAVAPAGPTNLEAGLKAIAARRPTDLYLITDGLPTKGNSRYRSLSPFANCSALWGSSKTISGECRVRLFQFTVGNAALSDVRVNVVLLPIEGDPDAAREFWSWTSATGGILISPAASWP